nr:XRE family transcriptional regulator [uncultured Brevundimonas sp.]
MNTAINALKNSSVYAEEALVVDLQSLLHTVMVEKGFTRSQLAAAMGVSKARVTQLFSDDCNNFTVRMLARALFALGEQLEVSCPTMKKAQARIEAFESLEQLAWPMPGDGQWQMHANENERLEIASNTGRTGGMIARAMSRFSDERLAA